MVKDKKDANKQLTQTPKFNQRVIEFDTYLVSEGFVLWEDCNLSVSCSVFCDVERHKNHSIHILLACEEGHILRYSIRCEKCLQHTMSHSHVATHRCVWQNSKAILWDFDVCLQRDTKQCCDATILDRIMHICHLPKIPFSHLYKLCDITSSLGVVLGTNVNIPQDIGTLYHRVSRPTQGSVKAHARLLWISIYLMQFHVYNDGAHTHITM